MTQPLCNYLDCHKPALYRAEYDNGFYSKPVLRCQEHGGHHDFGWKWEGGEWKEIKKGNQ